MYHVVKVVVPRIHIYQNCCCPSGLKFNSYFSSHEVGANCGLQDAPLHPRSMASVHLKTPVQSHPLLSEDIPSSSRGRRSRPSTGSGPPPRNTNNYFALRAQLERDGGDGSSWEGSVRGHEQRSTDGVQTASSSSSLAGMSTQAPLFVVSSSRDSASIHAAPELIVTSESDTNVFGTRSAVATQVLAAKWHEYSDEAIQTTISNLGASADVHGHPYHTAIRVLSSALHNLSRVRAELEEERRVLKEKEGARRERADALLKELLPSEQDIAKRVVQSIFADADEARHQVPRKQSFMASGSNSPI